MARPARSPGWPVTLGIVSVALSSALLTGWIVLIARSPSFSNALAANVLLLVGGVVSFATIMTVLILFSIFLVRVNQELRRQYSFLDSVTHELKSPLASIKLCVETMARPQVKEGQRTELRAMVLKDIERLAVFIDDILEASRLEHNKRAYSLAPVDVPAVARRCAAAVTTRHGIAHDAVSVDMPEGLLLVTDENALEVVLKNLIDNAVKYSDVKSVRVVVSAEKREGEVLVSVRDFGIGVPKVHLRRIFERFYRVPSATVNARTGTGLGLFVVSSLARALGATLEAHSEGDGRGTTFTVKFSRAKGAHS
jgi:signal transduction histidine kinase